MKEITGKELLLLDLPPLKYAVEPLLPQGLIILAGSMKIGKGWFVLHISAAVSTGARLWNFQTRKGKVLYIGYEDTIKRAQTRLLKQENYCAENITFWIGMDEEEIITGTLIEQIHEYIHNNPDIVLIVIDTLELARGNAIDKNPYRNDYLSMQKFHEIIPEESDITVLLGIV